MNSLTKPFIRNEVADTPMIFHRGEEIYHDKTLLFYNLEEDQQYRFKYTGNYGDYDISVDFKDPALPWLCNCPYPGEGCKHIVAAMLSILDLKSGIASKKTEPEEVDDFLTWEEMREQAIEERKKNAAKETFQIIQGDTYKGEHLLTTEKGRQYTVVLHNPETGSGHCSCPDFLTNRLGTCKHLLFLKKNFCRKKDFKKQLEREVFPFADIFWDSENRTAKLYFEDAALSPETTKLLTTSFGNDGVYVPDFKAFTDFCNTVSIGGFSQIVIQPEVINQLQAIQETEILKKAKEEFQPDYSGIKANLYPYQKEGIDFGLFKKAVLIGDEMGLGKTLQAITLSILKKEIFSFKKTLIITLASLKDQWKREIEKFSDEPATVISGNQHQRKQQYINDPSFFKITNYEAVLRDITIISDIKPDIIILDEAQRIKNFTTKTAEAVKFLPKNHAIVLTGTPLENKLEDVYSIVQFLDPGLLTPLWNFAGKHFAVSRKTKGKIDGYKNLDQLRETLSGLVIRRKKEEVLEELPETVTNNYYIDLTHQQEKMHAGYYKSLLPIIGKKYLTPVDIQLIQMLLLKMRMVCNSVFLIDKKSHISPKLKEFESVIHDLVIENKRKVVVFSEWTTMTWLVANILSKAGIRFVELSGKIPVKKRQSLIDEFTSNPDCNVFLSTDAGGTGLNLQAADCVINLELPWNPAKLNQRAGRVNRIGQKSKCINVINFIAKRSIEEKILSGIQMKTELFKGVFEDGENFVDFSGEKRMSLINQLRQMMGDEPETALRISKTDTPEISEETPYFLNPEVLRDDEEPLEKDQPQLNLTGEEYQPHPETVISENPNSEPADSLEKTRSESVNLFDNQPHEKIETVLNSGMAFIGGLLEMTTGKTIEPTGKDEKLLTIDKTTGEVTMKFKLPGF